MFKTRIALVCLPTFLLTTGSYLALYWPRLDALIAIPRYVRTHEIRKLQIGAGPNNLAGWLNTDIDPRGDQAYLDATRRLPFENRSLDYVFSEHLIEHFSYRQGLEFLRECHRVLKPGGKTRIATPNLLKFTALLHGPRDSKMSWFVDRKTVIHGWPQVADQDCYVLNAQMQEWGHRFIYTPKLLRSVLENAGFRDVREFKPGESDDLDLSGVEMRAKSSVNEYETMVLQAVRD